MADEWKSLADGSKCEVKHGCNPLLWPHKSVFQKPLTGIRSKGVLPI